MPERRRVETAGKGKRLTHLRLYSLDKSLVNEPGECSRCCKKYDRLWMVPRTSKGKILICNNCYREVHWIATRGLRMLKKNQAKGGDMLNKAIRAGHIEMKRNKG
jgi:NAD-dependent SIR2 family protein deacetylase